MAAVCSWAVRWDVHYVERTGSTNTDALALARAGAPVGTVVRAGHQTAGRGRLGRRWEAPPGSSLLASVLLLTEPAPFVAVARVALALRDACRDLAGLALALKWPNDLLAGEAKVAGILAEADGGSPVLVVGIGCNVVWPAGVGRPATGPGGVTALSDLVAAPPSPGELLDGLLARLDGWVQAPAGEVLSSYRAGCSTLGRRVRVQLADHAFEGTATGITQMGELVVATASGSRTVRAGDVVHLRAALQAPGASQ